MCLLVRAIKFKVTFLVKKQTLMLFIKLKNGLFPTNTEINSGRMCSHAGMCSQRKPRGKAVLFSLDMSSQQSLGLS